MAQKIPEEMIEQIRSKTDIVDIVGEYVQLTKRGRNYFGLCPFHGEQTPSFSVSTDKQIFHCFGCGAGGSAITFLMDIENISFQEATAKLGDRVGIHVEVSSSPEHHTHPISEEESRMKDAHAFAAEYYQHLLLNTEEGEQGLNYLQQRGFTREEIESNGVGFSLPHWDSLTQLLTRKGFSLEEMEQCGLIIKREDGSGYFDRFRGRVMFPIRDEQGKIIAFSGRILDSGGEDAKYLNSPESPIFHKGQVLYNLDQARPIIRKERNVVLFEGFMDVLSAKRAGVFNGVASMGTALTVQHMTKLKRLTDHIIVCYDGDKAGWEAARKAAEMLHAEQLNIEVAVLPTGLDPDEYIQQFGPEAFKEKVISEPQSYVAFMLMYARRSKNFQYQNDILQYVDEALNYLVEGISPIEKELYIKQIAMDTSITEETLQMQLRQKEAQIAKSFNQKESQPKALPISDKLTLQQKPLSAIDRAERLLLAHMLHNIDVADRIRQEEKGNPFIRDDYMAIYIHLIGFYEEYQKADYQRFAEVIGDRELRKIIMEAALVERDPNHAEEEISDCLKEMKKFIIKQQIQDKTHAIKEAEKMHDQRSALQLSQEVIDLTRSLSKV
ncbi:DNA primase [Rummeliibacillus sp. JY-2-4R]